MNRIRWYGPSVLLLVAVVGVLVAGPDVARQLVWAQGDERINQARAELDGNAVLGELSESFRRVAEVVQPSVVNIQAHGQPRERELRLPPELERFFDREDTPDRESEGPSVPRGSGSGWVYDDRGHIVTNYHVVADADQIEVEFQDGRRFDAQVIGADDRTDIAVLEVEATDLHPARLAEQEVHQGDIVFAFGSPFRFEFSMSQGIVSGKSRQLGILGVDGYENFIQTDAAINPGNSGGPLTNIRGEVVGMNTAIASRSRNPMEAGFMGLGFAIPAGMIQDVVEQLVEDGQVRRGYLGIMIEDLDLQMAQTFGYDSEDGVLVVDPLSGAPAAEAGIEAGDIIVSLNDQAVDTVQQLRQTVARMRPGTEVQVQVFRDGETEELTVELGEIPGQRSAAVPQQRPGVEPEADAAGLELLRERGVRSLQTYTQDLADRAGMAFEPGVLVEQVAQHSPAQRAGLVSGMLITRVMNQPVQSVEELAEQIEAHADRQTVRLRVALWNPGEERFQQRFVLLPLDNG